MAGELVSRFYFDRPGLPAIALTTDSSIMTAIGNDYSFERIFSRQIEANGVNGDIFIGISTSGNSSNIIEALKVAKNKGIITVGLTGKDGGLMKRSVVSVFVFLQMKLPESNIWLLTYYLLFS